MAITHGVGLINRVIDDFAEVFFGGTLAIYAGTRPVTPNTAPVGNPLVRVALPLVPFGDADAGEAVLAGEWQGTVRYAGTATWFRLFDAGGTRSLDGDVSEIGDGGDIEMEETTLTVGNVVAITAASLTAS
jgi:hypothetical protein